MAESEAVTRILWHAGLPFLSPGEELRPGSMSTATWKLDGIEKACEDLLHAFEQLNLEVNGAVPSEVGIDGKANELSRRTVWSVEQILAQMEEAHEKAKADDQMKLIAEAIDKVKFWWRSVLDGDIDDIPREWSLYLHAK